MVPGDRLLCTFIKDKNLGAMFKDWPLHITIIPWFRTDVATEELCRKMADDLRGINCFEITIGDESGFGHKGRKLVNLVEIPSGLEVIEQRARGLLQACSAWLVDETTKKKRPFRPHVTAQNAARVHKGDKYVCSRIYIVEQKGDYKEITGKIDL